MSSALALTGLLTTACAPTPDVLTLTALRFAGGMAAGAMVPLSIAHIGDTVPYGSRQATIARFLAATTMGQVIVGSLAGMFAVIAGGATVCASYGLMTLASSWLLFAPALALVGIGFFTMHSTLQTRATELAPEARGTALSGFSFCLFLGQGVGVYLISHIVDGPGYDYAFALASVGIAVLAAWLYRALRQRRER